MPPRHPPLLPSSTAPSQGTREGDGEAGWVAETPRFHVHSTPGFPHKQRTPDSAAAGVLCALRDAQIWAPSLTQSHAARKPSDSNRGSRIPSPTPQKKATSPLLGS